MAISVLNPGPANPGEDVTRPSSHVAAGLPDRVVGRPTVSVIIPAMNEAENIPHVLRRLPADIDELILVDGNSADGTVAVAKALRPDMRIVLQSGRGKGNALACGFAAASCDIAVTIDADGSMDPAEISTLVSTLIETGADYVKGSRLIASGGSDDLTPTRRIGNFALRTLVNLIYGTHYTDLCYGLSAFWRVHLTRLGISRENISLNKAPSRIGDGFEIETYLNIRAARAQLNVVEVPSYELARANGVSNLRVIRDGFRVLRVILTEWLHPVPVSSESDVFAFRGPEAVGSYTPKERNPGLATGDIAV
jgi:glycosyltransferase involved in cell wall biosynthesis